MFWAGIIAGFFIGGFFGVMMIGLLTMAREQTAASRDYSAPVSYDLEAR